MADIIYAPPSSSTGSLSEWLASTSVALGDTFILSSGVLGAPCILRSKSARTTRATFDATEAGNWDLVSQASVPEWTASTLMISGTKIRRGKRTRSSVLNGTTGVSWDSAEAAKFVSSAVDYAAEPLIGPTLLRFNSRYYCSLSIPTWGNFDATSFPADGDEIFISDPAGTVTPVNTLTLITSATYPFWDGTTTKVFNKVRKTLRFFAVLTPSSSRWYLDDGMLTPYRTVTATGGPELSWGSCYQADVTSGDMFVGIPSSGGHGGEEAIVIKPDSSPNTAIVLPPGGSTFEGRPTVELNSQFDLIRVIGTSSNTYDITALRIQENLYKMVESVTSYSSTNNSSTTGSTLTGMLASVTTLDGDLVVVNAVASHFIAVAASVSSDYLTSRLRENGVDVGNNAITNISRTENRSSGGLFYQRVATATTYNFTLACTRSANTDGTALWGAGSCAITVRVFRKSI